MPVINYRSQNLDALRFCQILTASDTLFPSSALFGAVDIRSRNPAY